MIDPTHPTNRPKLILCLLVTAALLGAFTWAGGADVVLSADRLHIVPFGAAFSTFGLWRGWQGKWNTTAWVGDRLPFYALVFVGYSVLLSIHDNPGAPIGPAVAKALVATTVCFASFIWLDVLQRVCERKVKVVDGPRVEG